MKSVRIPRLVFALIAIAIAVAIARWWGRPDSSGREGAEGAPRAANPAGIAAAPAPQPAPEGEAAGPGAAAEEEMTLADVLEEVGDLSVPGNRARAVERMREIEGNKRVAVEEQARKRGLPLRIEGPDGRVQELVGFENGQPVYFITHNANAAISTGASVLQAAPDSLSGSGLTVGVWDGGSVRAAHQEFATESRVTVKDGSASIDHATHVGGTVAAAGVVSTAKGMAPASRVDSYDWNNADSELAARAAAAPGEVGMLYLSNHSYGMISGWYYTGGAGSPSRMWDWYGDGTTSSGYEYDFGRYNTYARNSDSLAFSAPYFLMCRSAGNDRSDNPANGQTVALSPGSSTVVSYSSTAHPAGDNVYRGGFETIGFDAVAKNVLTVGSVADAVTSGVRDPSRAMVSSFSCWGPADDGRIKPDVVANGEGLYSSLNGSNSSYGSYSGTSMSSPDACGTATLLIEEYGRLFPGGAMRSSTLKALMIHTADDRGNAGPDYRYGWGLIHGVAAAALLRDHAANPLKKRIIEGLITSSVTTVSHEFVWDGASPIRATLCWTDPAGASTTTNDLRTPRLVNNLQLKISGPAGSEHLPFVMPFVGNWSQASMDLPATTGTNNVDNVEQVYLASPPAAGVYRCSVSFSGTLANNQQGYSLLISGSANEEPPPPPLSISGVSPASALPGTVTMDLTGAGFESGAEVRLIRSGQSDRVATSTTFNSATSLRCQFDLAGAAAGLWSVRVTNPDSETFALADAFTVLGALWSESFDGPVTGWTTQASTGSNAWTVTTAKAHSPASSYYAPGPAAQTTCSLISPSIAIPSSATNMQFKFWHNYSLQYSYDAGRLEFSVDGGASWFDVIAAGSGAAFASNGYNAVVNRRAKSDFANLPAWSGNSGGFIETIVNLTDTAKYAGKAFRARWRIATNNNTASAGWYVDTISLTGNANQSNQSPVITIDAASDSPETWMDSEDGTLFYLVAGQSTGLSVAAGDDGGEAALIYTWSGARAGGGEAPSFEDNASNAAKTTRAWFESSGDYLFTVTVTDVQGLAASSSVNVRVEQTASSLSVSPATASVTVGGTQAYTATALDQFGAPLGSQPSLFDWSLSGGGSIDPAGLFSATAAGGPFVVSATSGSLSGIATVTVNPAPAAVELGNLTQTYDGSPKPVIVTTTPAGLAVSVTYDGSPAAPAGVGSYAVIATITDPNYQGGASATLTIEAPLDPYDAWTAENELGGDAAQLTADGDGDGVCNLLEFAAGMDPAVADLLPVGVAKHGDSLHFTYWRNKNATNLTFAVEWSDDLALPDWSTEGVGDPVVIEDAGETERIEVAVPAGTAVSQRFVRLRVTRR